MYSEIEEININFDYDDEPKKDVISYETVEKNIRCKFKNGEAISYEVTLDFGREEVFDEKLQKMVKKQKKQKKSFKTLQDAQLYKNEFEKKKILADDEKVEIEKKGYTLIQVANVYYDWMKKQVAKGVRSETYLEQIRIQTDHFKKFFTGEETTYVKDIKTEHIEQYFEFEESRNISKKSIQKYKTHLKALWTLMLKNKEKYGVTENVVLNAQITAPESKYKAASLNYIELNELITEAVNLEDPTFLYLVVFSMTQGLRRGELCGLQWGDINFKTNRITIKHNRVQLVTKDTTKLPKREKIREIELHKAGLDTILLYKKWQESILNRSVKNDEFVLQWEINLVQNYVAHTGKISRRWKEIYKQINDYRIKNKKDVLPYGRIHDGRHTYITLLLHGIKKEDGTIIPPASFFQVYESAGHTLPKSMQNVSNTVYNDDHGDRWDITRFWNDTINVDISELWKKAIHERKQAEDNMTELEKSIKEEQKRKRYEKAEKERLKHTNQPEDAVYDYLEETNDRR